MKPLPFNILRRLTVRYQVLFLEENMVLVLSCAFRLRPVLARFQIRESSCQFFKFGLEICSESRVNIFCHLAWSRFIWSHSYTPGNSIVQIPSVFTPAPVLIFTQWNTVTSVPVSFLCEPTHQWYWSLFTAILKIAWAHPGRRSWPASVYTAVCGQFCTSTRP